MRAVRLHATRDLRFETVDAPLPPRADEVTLRVTAAGISHEPTRTTSVPTTTPMRTTSRVPLDVIGVIRC